MEGWKDGKGRLVARAVGWGVVVRHIETKEALTECVRLGARGTLEATR